MVLRFKKPVEDPFAKERALFHAMRKDKKDEDPTIEVIRKILEEHGLTRMEPPKKGEDYFTDEEIEKFKDEVLSRVVVPEVVVDYEALYAYITTRVMEEFSKIPLPKNGQNGKDGEPGTPGKDAVVDMDEIVRSVIAKLPKPKKEASLTLKEVKEYVEEQIKNIPRQPVRIGGSVASIRALTDIDLTGVQTDSKGNYIINPYHLFVGTVAPSSPVVNDLWVDTN